MHKYSDRSTTPMKWFKFSVYFRYPLALVFYIILAVLNQHLVSRILLMVYAVLLLLGEVYLLKKRRRGIIFLLISKCYLLLILVFAMLFINLQLLPMAAVFSIGTMVLLFVDCKYLTNRAKLFN